MSETRRSRTTLWSTKGHFLGTYASLEEARKAPARHPLHFDADSYRILVHPILRGGAEIVPLF